MGEQWILYPSQAELAQKLAHKYQLSLVTAQLLVNRGLTDSADVDRHLNSRLADLPDPRHIPGVPEAVDLLIEAIQKQKRVVLFGDYDVDGMTGCATLLLFLRRCGLEAEVYIPDRSSEGYGLSILALQKIHEQGADIVVTIDNGTSAFEELQWAADHDMQAIVIDHHESPTRMPPCAALVNPKHPQSEHPDKTLCSAGLTFNLVVALRAALRSQGFFKDRSEPDLKECLDLTCLGTIADMVPLQGQNRLLVQQGLKVLAEAKRPGIAALKLVSSLEGKTMGSGDVSFQLAPRLNAAGRMADARLGVQLLTTEDSREAQRLAEQLNRLNQERRGVESQMIDEAVEQVEAQAPEFKKFAIVVASEDWHPGVMGIVAAKLTELYHLPAFVIALNNGQGKGSARSFGGINLYDALQKSSDHLTRYGGHQAAAGLTIERDQVEAFTRKMQEAVETLVPPEGLSATLKIDQVLATHEVNEEVVSELQNLEPYGIGNPSPLFMTEPIRLDQARVVGNGHLKVRVTGERYSWDGIGFGLAESFGKLAHQGLFEVAYRPEWNVFQGQRRIQLRLKSLRPA